MSDSEFALVCRFQLERRLLVTARKGSTVSGFHVVDASAFQFFRRREAQNDRVSRRIFRA